MGALPNDARRCHEEAQVQRLIASVLAAWREAERVAEGDPGPAHDAAVAAAAQLRDVYQTLALAAPPEQARVSDLRLDSVRRTEPAVD